MNVYEVVTKLVGPIDPVGDAHEDRARLENQRVMQGLVDQLLFDISRVAMWSADHRDHRASVSKAGKEAKAFIKAVEDGGEETE